MIFWPTIIVKQAYHDYQGTIENVFKCVQTLHDYYLSRLLLVGRE